MGFKVIISKELKRVFGDKKMIFSMFILPVIIMVAVYGVMFIMMNKTEDKINKHVSSVCIYNAAQGFKDSISGNADLSVTYLEGNEPSVANMESVKEGALDLIILFPEDFENQVAKENKDDTMIQIKTFYNPSEDNSSEARRRMVEGYLEQYRLSLVKERFGSISYANVFAVDNDNSEMVVQDDGKATGKVLGMIVPYFISIMLFAGAMGLGVDSIAGEKERGTMANILISPVKRVEIVMGKIVGLGIVSVLSAATYVVSMLAFVLVGGKVSPEVNAILSKFSLKFTGTQIVELIVLLIGIVWLYVSIIGIVSILSKNIKEAQSFVAPVYMVVMILGMVNMYQSGKASDSSFLIPLYNLSITFRGIFTNDITIVQYLMAVGVTYGAAIIIVAMMTKAIKSEKIMLNA